MALSDMEPWAYCSSSLEMGDDHHSSASCHYHCSSQLELASRVVSRCMILFAPL